MKKRFTLSSPQASTPHPKPRTTSNDPPDRGDNVKQQHSFMTRLVWIAIGVLVLARLCDFWGLHYGNTDDLVIDYHSMAIGRLSAAYNYAISQSRISHLVLM